MCSQVARKAAGLDREPEMNQRGDVRAGMLVLSREGIQVGRVVGLEPHGFVVTAGSASGKEYAVDYEDVQVVRGDTLLLAIDQNKLVSRSDARGTHEQPSAPSGGLGLSPGDFVA